MKKERQLAGDLGVGLAGSYSLDQRDLDLLGRIRELPFRQRQAIVLFYLEDIPLPVVADLMNVSEGTVKAHLAQARVSLRRQLEVKDAR